MDTIIVAGATGDLGGRIAKAAVARGAKVRALVRPGTAPDRIARLEAIGADPHPVDFDDAQALSHACRGVVCVVSALNGLGETILDAQTRLLDAALGGGAARFIPSDFSIDYRALPTGTNRNFDLRRAFRTRIDTSADHGDLDLQRRVRRYAERTDAVDPAAGAARALLGRCERDVRTDDQGRCRRLYRRRRARPRRAPATCISPGHRSARAIWRR